MANAVAFKLITPVAVKFDGEAEIVIATGTEGEIGVLANHAPYLTALKPGVLRADVRDASGARRLELATSEGFLQALPDRVTILVDAAMTRDEVDVTKARDDLQTATDRQRQAGSSDLEAWRREQAAIDFATARLRVSGQT